MTICTNVIHGISIRNYLLFSVGKPNILSLQIIRDLPTDPKIVYPFRNESLDLINVFNKDFPQWLEEKEWGTGSILAPEDYFKILTKNYFVLKFNNQSTPFNMSKYSTSYALLRKYLEFLVVPAKASENDNTYSTLEIVQTLVNYVIFVDESYYNNTEISTEGDFIKISITSASDFPEESDLEFYIDLKTGILDRMVVTGTQSWFGSGADCVGKEILFKFLPEINQTTGLSLSLSESLTITSNGFGIFIGLISLFGIVYYRKVNKKI